MKYDVFISYRRLDNNGNVSGRDVARIISNGLKSIGLYPFFDYEVIKDNRFDDTIIPAVQTCDIFLLILSKDALNRCSYEDDWLRREIQEALKSTCKIILVTPDKAFAGWPDDFPNELDELKRIQISDLDMGSNYDVTFQKLINDRFNLSYDFQGKYKDMFVLDVFNVNISKRVFAIPDEFFNDAVHNALKRSYE